MYFGNKCHYVCEDTLLLQDFTLLPWCIWGLHSSWMLCSKHWKSIDEWTNMLSWNVANQLPIYTT